MPRVPGGRSSWLGAAFGAVAGSVFGVAATVVVVVPRLGATPAKEPAATGEGQPVGVRQALPNGQSVRIAALERRLATLEERGPEQELRVPLAPSTAGRAPADPEAERSAFEAALAAHEAEPTGTPWASRSVARFQADLGALGTLRAFSLDRVDCRAESCTAEVEWSSRAEAETGWRAILTADYEVNCARRIRLRDAPDAQGRVHADVLFDCAGHD